MVPPILLSNVYILENFKFICGGGVVGADDSD